ncbi:MAG: retropepsin-like aspartic protease family protein [Methylosarcina sp.]
MGIHDRDYYREKYRKSYSPKKRRTDKQYLLTPILTLALLWYGADVILGKMKNRLSVKLVPALSTGNPSDLISGGIILKADRQGHFRGTVSINNVPMPFLIDTGATTTTIPENMAIAAGLPVGRSIQSNTAGGKVLEHLTWINSLKIGNAEIKNLNANINQHLDEVLIGMNTLKYFRMTQDGNTLTLVTYKEPEEGIAEPEEEIAEIENRSAPPPPQQKFQPSNDEMPVETVADYPIKKFTWKKSVSCDGHNNCKTIYSDH